MPVYIRIFNEKDNKIYRYQLRACEPEIEQMAEGRRYIAKYNSTHKYT